MTTSAGIQTAKDTQHPINLVVQKQTREVIWRVASCLSQLSECPSRRLDLCHTSILFHQVLSINSHANCRHLSTTRRLGFRILSVVLQRLQPQQYRVGVPLLKAPAQGYACFFSSRIPTGRCNVIILQRNNWTQVSRVAVLQRQLHFQLCLGLEWVGRLLLSTPHNKTVGSTSSCPHTRLHSLCRRPI